MKLVRDKLDQVIPADVLREATPDEVFPLLVAKTREETAEIEECAGNDIVEFADTLEALMALAEACGHNWADVEAARLAKLEERGGFSRHLVFDPSPDMIGAINILGKAARLTAAR